MKHGERAKLRGANLRGAVLEGIKGKEIISFQAGRHFAYKEEGYTEAEIKDYGFYTHYIANRSRYA